MLIRDGKVCHTTAKPIWKRNKESGENWEMKKRRDGTPSFAREHVKKSEAAKSSGLDFCIDQGKVLGK
jgi:hypothetical protein